MRLKYHFSFFLERNLFHHLTSRARNERGLSASTRKLFFSYFSASLREILLFLANMLKYLHHPLLKETSNKPEETFKQNFLSRPSHFRPSQKRESRKSSLDETDSSTIKKESRKVFRLLILFWASYFSTSIF